VFSHVMIGSNDLERTKIFYDATLGTLGGKPATYDKVGRLVYVHGGGVLMISKPIDGQPASGANGGTIGFVAKSTEDADAWHKAGVENGGTAIEDPPGERNGSAGPMYIAYLRDPDGNKLCVLHRIKS